MTTLERRKTIETLTLNEEKAIEAALKGMKNQATNFHNQFKADFQEVEKAVECKGMTMTSCKLLDSILHESVMKAVDRACAITGATSNQAFKAMKTF